VVKQSFFSPFLACAAAVVALAAPLAAHASDPFLTIVPGAERSDAPAQRYALLSRDEALAALRARGVIFDEVAPERAPGVVAPVRLTSRLHGVFIHGSGSEEARARSPYETLDARLALALDDFMAILRRHDIDEIVHFSMYRPGGGRAAPARRAAPSHRTHRTASRLKPLPQLPPSGHTAKAADVASSKAADVASSKATDVASSKATDVAIPSAGQATSRHPAGLAIDVASLRKTDGSWLKVASDFHGHIGAQTCGEGVRAPEAPEARELREIVCEAVAQKLFTYVLTPNYNYAHRDHFHMEIKGGVPWMLVH
jgi:hypothetical protein